MQFLGGMESQTLGAFWDVEVFKVLSVRALHLDGRNRSSCRWPRTGVCKYWPRIRCPGPWQNPKLLTARVFDD